MEKFNENAVQDPRGSESSVKPNEREKDQEQTRRHPEEQEQSTPTTIPDDDKGDAVSLPQEPDTKSSGDKKENLIPVKNADVKQGEDEEDEKEKKEEDEEDREEMDSDDKDSDSEGDKTRSQSGDDFSSPADFNDTNFEDPARGRKTDPMTDHEPRIAGI